MKKILLVVVLRVWLSCITGLLCYFMRSVLLLDFWFIAELLQTAIDKASRTLPLFGKEKGIIYRVSIV